MAAAAAASRRREQAAAERDAAAAPALSGQSYWLDLWLFVLFDLALFVLIYLLP
uniref:Uncharacterized protein n=1 Tax=Cairina moschata TaxID=8855 RepID=A0A8C3CDI4_CAIMO